MRRAFKLSVRVGDQTLTQEVDAMSLIGANSPGDYIDAMTEHMMRKAEAMQYRQEQAIIHQQAQMGYHQAFTSITGPYAPGQVIPNNVYGGGFDGAVMQCVGNGWNTTTAPVKQAFRNAVKFFRVNEEVEMEEGASYGEPLDELRLKVKRWLKK